MDRRRFVGVVAGGLFAAPTVIAAQPTAKVPTIGMLLPGTAPLPGQPAPPLDAFRSGLRALGYVEGKNVIIEPRWSEGRDERFSELAKELVRRNVAVIVTQATPAVLAAKAATRTIPVVMAFAGDPVGIGVAASLAHPGANITGLSTLDAELDGKRIELLKEAVPGLTRVAILWSANDTGMTLAFSRVEDAARKLGLSVESLAVRDADALPVAFDTARSRQSQALIVTAQPFIQRNRAQILELVVKYRMPAMYTLRGFVDAGGLMAYGPILPDMFRRAAGYVDKILRGGNPADMPIEQPTKFELVINLKTAKALGLTIPQSLLLRADEVIQ